MAIHLCTTRHWRNHVICITWKPAQKHQKSSHLDSRTRIQRSWLWHHCNLLCASNAATLCFSPSWGKTLSLLRQIRRLAELLLARHFSDPLVESLLWMLCSIDTHIIKHICQMVAGFDLWPKSNQFAEHFAGARLQEKLLLMEHLRQATHFYMLIYMLKHNINVKTLDDFGAEQKCSLVLSSDPNLCMASVLTLFSELWHFLGFHHCL